jgi:hypothetical protein
MKGKPKTGDIVYYCTKDTDNSTKHYAYLLVTEEYTGKVFRNVLILYTNTPNWGSGVTRWNEALWDYAEVVA